MALYAYSEMNYNYYIKKRAEGLRLLEETRLRIEEVGDKFRVYTKTDGPWARGEDYDSMEDALRATDKERESFVKDYIYGS